MSALIPAELRQRYVAAGQDQVFKYVDESKMADGEVAQLVAQLEKLDLDRIAKVHKDAMDFDLSGQDNLGKLEPLDSYDSTMDLSEELLAGFKTTGLAAIASGEAAALVLAGGAGTRLGFPHPKGMYSIGLPSGKSLFQLFAERLANLRALSGGEKYIPWYIMTSEGDNHQETLKFFEDNRYFGYPQDSVIFFSQGTLPCLTLDGKIMLETGCRVGTAADGNGGIYAALQSTGQIADMRKRGVKFVHCFSVDNAVGKVADPVFLGYCIQRGSDLGNKVVWKAEPMEKVGIVGKRGGRNAVIEYSEMKEEDCKRLDAKGKLMYGAGNVCNHFYTLGFLEKIRDEDLIFHVARKKIKQPSDDGKTAVDPVSNTGIKLEAFIFDCFGLSTNMAVLEGPRDEEFSPVKNPVGDPKDSPDTARAMLTAQSKKWLEAAGAILVNGDGAGQVEISPSLSYRGEGLERFKGVEIDCSKDVMLDSE